MNVLSIANHKAHTCECGSVNFALVMSGGIECNKCGKPHPLKWSDLDASECEDCCGKGWNSVQRQVAERESDVQTFHEECDTCEGTGWVGPDASDRTLMEMQAFSWKKPKCADCSEGKTCIYVATDTGKACE